MAARNRKAEFEYTRNFIDALSAEDMHEKRIYSLANATLGVMTSASLAVSTIGHGLALARGRLNKHEIKQVDRLLSNPGVVLFVFDTPMLANGIRGLAGTDGAIGQVERGFA
jgi:hypothetical protein